VFFFFFCLKVSNFANRFETTDKFSDTVRLKESTF